MVFPPRLLRPHGLRLGLVLVLALASASPLHAQDDEAEPDSLLTNQEARVVLGGFVQARTSYGYSGEENGAGEGQARFGVGLRRVRLTLNAQRGPFGLFFGWEASSATVFPLDVFVRYAPVDRVRLRLGRFPGAQPRGFILTPAPVLDVFDRPVIAERWGALTGVGRDFGLDAQYRSARTEVLLTLHNGDGDWDRLRGNYREGPSSASATGGIERTVGAISLYAQHALAAAPSIEFGGFAGYNGAASPATALELGGTEVGRSYATYSGHVYWGATPGSQPVRLKLDVIGLRFEEASAGPLEREAQHVLGVSAFGAVRATRGVEVFARGEQLDRAGTTYLTTGLSFSPSARRGEPYARERLTLGYSTSLPNADDAPAQHLVILQAQFVF